MPVETLTYAAFGARLSISAKAARSLAKRLGLPRSLSNDGKAVVSVDIAELRHTPRPRRSPAGGDAAPLAAARITTLQAEVARLEAVAAGHRADYERERERADRLMVELLQATAETMAAKETTARLEGFLRASRVSGSNDGHGLATRRPGLMAADIVAADRKASR